MTPIAGFISIFPYGEAKGKSGLEFFFFLAREPQALLSFGKLILIISLIIFITNIPDISIESLVEFSLLFS